MTIAEKAFDLALGILGGPQNTTKAQPPNESPFQPGSSSSPMDNVRHRKSPPPDRLANVPHPERETFLAISREIGDDLMAEIAPAGDLKTIKALQTEIKRLHDFDLHLATSANEDWNKHCAEHAAKIAAGDTSATGDVWSREEFTHDYYERRKLVRAEIQRRSPALLAASAPIRQRWVDAAETLADGIEATERLTHEKFGIRYQPSAVLLAILKAVSNIRHEGESWGLPFLS